jgi:hypothetical protein
MSMQGVKDLQKARRDLSAPNKEVSNVPNLHWQGDLDRGGRHHISRRHCPRVGIARRIAENRMITPFDFRPSQNAWKVRQLLWHLRVPYQSDSVSAFESDGRRVKDAPVDHWGPVPVVRLEDGRVLSESNTILFCLSGNTAYRPEDPFKQAKVFQ